MRKAIAAALFVAAAAVASGCSRNRVMDAGPQTSREFPVGAFSGIEVDGAYDVRVRTGGTPSVKASGPQNVIDQLVVEVRGDELQIHPRKNRSFHFGRHAPVTIEVVSPGLKAASLAGSGNLVVDQVKGSQFDGSIAGSGSIALPSIDVQLLKISVAGSGGASGAGTAATGDYSIAGSGNIDLQRVTHRDIEISVAGSGNVTTAATGSAAISIMGSGNATVTGGAKCTISKMGSGEANCS